MSDRRIAGDTGAFETVSEPARLTTEAALRSEVGRLRQRDVDRYVTTRIDLASGEVTTAEVEAWESHAYRMWRETWPTLNSLLLPHSIEDPA